MDIVMANINRKMNIHEAIEMFNCREMTVFRAFRVSDRGSKQQIYILGGGKGYSFNVGGTYTYVTDTGRGYGGRGKVQIIDEIVSGTDYKNKIMSSHNILELNETERLPVWVFK